VLIAHEDIKGFMPAMTMPYKVRATALLEGKAPGDLVRATLHVADTDAWLSSLETIGTAPLDKPAEIPAAAFITPLRPGDEVPATQLIDQEGRHFSLADWRGQAIAVTFIYVRCPLPQFCPLMDRRFAEVQRAIFAMPTLDGQVRLLSVSFDPDADTPQQLRAHAARVGADPRVWRFATAPREVIDRFAAQFGVNVVRERDRTITHNLRTVVVDRLGRLVSVHEGSNWTASDIVDELQRAQPR
jgi:protein SCO1/2